MPIHFDAWTAMLEPHQLEFSEDHFFEYAGMPSARIIQVLAEAQGRTFATSTVDSMAANKEARYIAMLDTVRPVAAVLSVAERYRGVLPMAVASGGEGWVVRRTLAAIGALEWFEAIVGAEDTERHKPEPDVFLEAARRLGVEPHACVVFEDSDLGLLAAERAGMLGVDIRGWPPVEPA
jgi:beta-phosphoglucomutase-like phosphatase (HAD superfamily)